MISGAEVAVCRSRNWAQYVLDLAGARFVGTRETTELGCLLKRADFGLLKIHKNRGFCALIEAVAAWNVSMPRIVCCDACFRYTYEILGSASLRKIENPALPCDERWTHYVQNGWKYLGSDRHKKRALNSRRGAGPSSKKVCPVHARLVSCTSKPVSYERQLIFEALASITHQKTKSNAREVQAVGSPTFHITDERPSGSRSLPRTPGVVIIC